MIAMLCYSNLDLFSFFVSCGVTGEDDEEDVEKDEEAIEEAAEEDARIGRRGHVEDDDEDDEVWRTRHWRDVATRRSDDVVATSTWGRATCLAYPVVSMSLAKSF